MTARRIRQRPEQGIQIAIVAFLRLALPKPNVVFHCPNEGRRSEVEGGMLKRLGLLTGFPDLGLLIAGRLYVAEVKAPGRDTTDAQDACIAALQLAGATYLGVWRSVADCARALDDAGIRLRAHPFGLGVRRAA